MRFVQTSPTVHSAENLEKLTGIVERVTFHNVENGWTVLKVSPFREPGRLVTVLIHQAKVFAGATMEFHGTYSHHPKHGEQFKAVQAVEKKPASAAALEKYLGSGLIRGVGPATAKKIVGYFSDRTLEVFEKNINELLDVPGIADKKLEQIRVSWEEHKSIRDVMLFLQGYGISTLFATKIYKAYGDEAIAIVSCNPYRLAHDIYGIGFFSADTIARSMGFERTGRPRLEAGIKHVLQASREEGHCFLTEGQIFQGVTELLDENLENEYIANILNDLLSSDQIKKRVLLRDDGNNHDCFYSKSLYFAEQNVAIRIQDLLRTQCTADRTRIQSWMSRYTQKHGITLSDEQSKAVAEISEHGFSILTGGPGCGKTTCTKVLVGLLQAMGKKVVLSAPTGRAAQRLGEVVGAEAKTIHRLLEWLPDKNGFKRDKDNPINADFLIVDETSMLDISLASALLGATSASTQVLFIGDPDQLPAVGSGAVLSDLLRTETVPHFRLTKIFRQAEQSSIIRFAHEINRGITPRIISPIAQPKAFFEGHDCLFVDADEATQEQASFLRRATSAFAHTIESDEVHLLKVAGSWAGRINREKSGSEIEVDRLYRPDDATEAELKSPVLSIPEKLKNVDLEKLARASSGHEQLMSVIQRVHPWSTLHFGLTALQTTLRLYTKTIPEWLGGDCEIQVLCPQVRGSLGTLSLNEALQAVKNPPAAGKHQLLYGGRILRVGDRVIQTRNNYDLNVFNGDIGRITEIETEDMACTVRFSSGDAREVVYERDDLSELSLAYAVTIHKSQGSEFPVVIIPVVGQHFNMLFRSLIYTGLTRAKRLAVFVGSRRALTHAIAQVDSRHRQTALQELVVGHI